MAKHSLAVNSKFSIKTFINKPIWFIIPKIIKKSLFKKLTFKFFYWPPLTRKIKNKSIITPGELPISFSMFSKRNFPSAWLLEIKRKKQIQRGKFGHAPIPCSQCAERRQSDQHVFPALSHTHRVSTKISAICDNFIFQQVLQLIFLSNTLTNLDVNFFFTSPSC